LDWNTPPAYARTQLGNLRVVQGNLDPCMLYASHDRIRLKTHEMIAAFGRHHIVNLGHGVYPDTPLDGVKCFVDTVKGYRYA
jgi:uroporphyrinogen decarboxylase